MSETVVRYEGGLRCRAAHAESGAVIVTDAPKDLHGRGESFSPSDLLAVSLGGCILSIMAVAAQSMQIDMSGATATVSKEMANAPRRISKISVMIHVEQDLDARARAKLEAAAHSCPVHNALGIEAPIAFSWNQK